MELTWEITKEEQIKRQKKVLPIMFVVMVIAAFGTALQWLMFNEEKSNSIFIFWLLPTVVGFLVGLYYLLLNILPFPNYSYRLGEEGIRIIKNKKSANLAWCDFKHFYDYSKSKSNIFDDRETAGCILYLEKNNVLIGRKFYVVLTNPDNTEEVKSYLNKYLPESEYTNRDELGLKFIKFK